MGVGSARLMAFSGSVCRVDGLPGCEHGVLVWGAAGADISRRFAGDALELHGLGQRLDHRQEVEDPQRNYPRAMFTAALTVVVYYATSGRGLMAGIPAAQFSTGAWVDAASLLGGTLAVTVVLAGSLDGLGI